jgi:dihydrofolate synthase/folylpolyglutamate synthase
VGESPVALEYEDAVALLSDSLKFGIHPSLDAITSLCEALERPQDDFRAVQVAGTNGKTSVTWMIEAILSAGGVSAGAYTSPHLTSYTERVRLGGADCTRDEFAAAIDSVTNAAADAGIDAPTEFEILTAGALWLLRERCVDTAVLEVGMGGRWDATSVVDPEVAVVTSVGLDHMEHLGDTREEIAAEKACVIEEGTATVLGPGTRGVEHIFEQRAIERGAGIVRVGQDAASVCGFTLPRGMPSYQAANAVTAKAAAEALLGEPVDDGLVTEALAKVRLPARFETVSTDPVIIADGSHNPQAAEVLRGAIEERFQTPPTLVLAVLADKDAAGVVDALAPAASSIVVTQSDSPRAVEAADLAAIVRRQTGVEPPAYDSLGEALETLKVDLSGGLVVTGSLTIAAEARQALLDG